MGSSMNESVDVLRQTSEPRKYPISAYLIGIYLALMLISSIAAIVAVHINIIPLLARDTLLRAHVMCGSFGVIGGCLSYIRKYYRVLIRERMGIASADWSLGWCYYYLIRPLIGGVLGALVYTLSFVGLQIVTGPHPLIISNEGRYLLYGIAFLVGYSASAFLNRLESISKQMFEHVESVEGDR